MGQVLDLFSPPVRDWFRAAFAEPTSVQERGWQEVAAGRHKIIEPAAVLGLLTNMLTPYHQKW